MSSGAGGASGIKTIQGFLQPIAGGYVQLTSVSAATALSAGQIPDGAKMAMIQPEAQNIRWTDDGTTPTASVGMILVANDTLFYSGTFASLKFIEVSATAKINITFYR